MNERPTKSMQADANCVHCSGDGVIEYDGTQDSCICVKVLNSRRQAEQRRKEMFQLITAAVMQALGTAARLEQEMEAKEAPAEEGETQ